MLIPASTGGAYGGGPWNKDPPALGGVLIPASTGGGWNKHPPDAGGSYSGYVKISWIFMFF